jgi:tetratricopeptide (TPR) repeat protein
VLFLSEQGRYDEALALLQQTRPLYDQLRDRMNLVRLRWLEGKIEAGRGSSRRAEELLREVRAELVARDLGYDAALLSLDLARLLVHQGRSEEMRRLAEEMIPIFQSRDIHREAIAALIVFQKAAEMERVTVSLVQELSDYLRRSRNQPDLRLPSSF